MALTAAQLEIDVEAIDRSIADHATFPARWYSDPQIHAFEMDTFWNRGWQLAGIQSDLAMPGDFIVAQAGQVPVIVARGEDGGISGFVNVCPHRGYPLASKDSPRGRGEFECFYHGWTFGLDGALRAAPGTEKEPSFDAKSCRLHPVSIDLWGEAIFVNADPAAGRLEMGHPRFKAFAGDLGLEPTFAKYRHFETRTYDVATNWKLFGDNYLECYHCPTVHPTSLLSGFDASTGQWEYLQVDELFSSRFVPDPGSNGLQYYGALQAVPGFLIIQHDDFALLAQAVPTGPESTRFTAHFYREPDSDDARVAEWLRVWDSTFVEDFEVMEIQQRTLRETGITGRYIPASEQLLIRFQEILWGGYKRALGVAGRVSAEEMA